jgi:hypothetical protein
MYMSSYYIGNLQAFVTVIKMTKPIYFLIVMGLVLLSENKVFGFIVPMKVTSSSLKAQQENSNDSLRDEIAAMKKQALDRLDVLDAKLSETAVAVSTVSSNVEINEMGGRTTNTESYESTKTQVYNPTEDISEREYADKRIAVSNDPAYYNSRTESYRKNEALLEGTSWKLSLDIGREPGTWMPKDWGVSGERLKLNLEFEFTENQLYDREEFLGGIGDARILQVKGNEMTLAPSLTEGSRKIRVLDGGWRVAKGQGPMGTDLVRFYIETEELISRKGKDIYLKPGRIYCNAGYFATNRKGKGYKAQIKKELDNMILRAEELDVEIEQCGPFSIDRFKKNTELFQLKVEMQRKADLFRSASVAEPSSSILKFSPRGDVGLTREGGVCCKVNKGISLEYHILGRFYISPSLEN